MKTRTDDPGAAALRGVVAQQYFPDDLRVRDRRANAHRSAR